MADPTNTPLQNFRLWFVNPIKELGKDGDAGFAILLIVFPLLERYLREESGIHEDIRLPTLFYEKLRTHFPVLATEDVARQFWNVYRNGLLHQATISIRPWNGLRVPAGWLSSQGSQPIEIDPANDFVVHPNEFAKYVIGLIETKFFTFAAQGSPNFPFPSVHIRGATPDTRSVGNPIVPSTGNAAPSQALSRPGNP